MNKAGYRLDRGRPVGPDLRRVALEQVDRALALLHDSSLPPERRVHEVRKRGKMLRALLRLVGQKKLAALYRDVGRELSASRDAAVILATFESLADAGEHDEIRTVFAGRADAVGGEGGGLEQIAASVEPRIREGRQRIAALGLDPYGFEELVTACGRTYRLGRHARRIVVEDATSDAVHDWRKRVKDHWYHLRLLATICPAVAGERRRAMDSLGESLGNANDLAVLRDAVVALGSGDTLLPRIDRRRNELVTGALASGAPLYEGKAKVFCHSLRAAHLR